MLIKILNHLANFASTSDLEPKPMLSWMMKSQAGVLSLRTGQQKNISNHPKTNPCHVEGHPECNVFLSHTWSCSTFPTSREGLSKIFPEDGGGDSCEMLSSGSVLSNDETNFTCGKISSFVKFGCDKGLISCHILVLHSSV